MPKRVDAEARRRAVVDALFRVVVREGLQRASLRTVADEAGLNIGSLRHYFAGQAELMDFAMRSMVDRVADRLERRVAAAGDLETRAPAERFEVALDVLGELLPLDERRRAEITVYLDFSTAARTNPEFAPLALKAAAGTRKLVRLVLKRLLAAEVLRPGLDVHAEAERVAALVDGLGFRAVLHPDALGAQECAEVLRRHLAGLAVDGIA